MEAAPSGCLWSVSTTDWNGLRALQSQANGPQSMRVYHYGNCQDLYKNICNKPPNLLVCAECLIY